MFNESSSPDLFNCTFTNNSADSDGGGMYNANSSDPSLADCAFTGNSARASGGGLANRESCPTLTNCTFTSNSATEGNAGLGGGMYNSSSSPSLTDCTFTSNSASNGGGMCSDASSPTLTNCKLIGNVADYFGGGVFNSFFSSDAVFSGCVFNGNQIVVPSDLAQQIPVPGGAGMCNHESDVTISNCLFSQNDAGSGLGGGVQNHTEQPQFDELRVH